LYEPEPDEGIADKEIAVSNNFGALLRDLRKRNGMTQEELALRLGYSRAMVAMLEAGKRQPDVEEVIDLYIPALGLEQSRDLASRLVELAANLRREGRPVQRRTVTLHHRMQRTRETRNDSHIPAAITPFLGREREVETLARRFLENEIRFLTLVGPPGVGKTRLAQEIARRLDLFFEQGIYFVSLAGVNEPDSVLPSILAALNVQGGSGGALATLVAYLRNKDVLLVLDNFEQILAAAPQLARIQSECAGVQMLVTSRERLRLRAEYVAQVQPLPLDVAVELLMERASAVNPLLDFAESDSQVIETICRRLDCLPLAIELCAAQVDYYPLARLMAQLEEHSLDMLEDGAADLSPHQQTLRAAIRQSWEMLNEDERSLLQALSVFAGGATAEMAEKVWKGFTGAKEESEQRSDFDKVAQGLMAKSLVRVETTALGDRRLMVLESIREFGQEQIEKTGNLDAVRALHFDACLYLARECELHMWSEEIPAWQSRFRVEMNNIRAAILWAYETGQDQQLSWLLIPVVQLVEPQVFNELAHWSLKLIEGQTLLPPAVRLRLHAHCALSAMSQKQFDSMRNHLFEVRRLVDACSDFVAKAEGMTLFGRFMLQGDEYISALRTAIEYAHAASGSSMKRELFGLSGSREWVTANALYMFATITAILGEVDCSYAAALEARDLSSAKKALSGELVFGRICLMRRDFVAAHAHFREAIEHARKLRNPVDAGFARAHTALSALYCGDLVTAEALLSENRVSYREEYGLSYLPITYLFSAETALDAGDIEAARVWQAEGLALPSESLGQGAWRILRLLVAARIAAASGKDEYAATLYGTIHGYDQRIRLGPTAMIRDSASMVMAEVRKQLGERNWHAAYTTGWALSPEEALQMTVDNTIRFRIDKIAPAE